MPEATGHHGIRAVPQLILLEEVQRRAHAPAAARGQSLTCPI